MLTSLSKNGYNCHRSQSSGFLLQRIVVSGFSQEIISWVTESLSGFQKRSAGQRRCKVLERGSKGSIGFANSNNIFDVLESIFKINVLLERACSVPTNAILKTNNETQDLCIVNYGSEHF